MLRSDIYGYVREVENTLRHNRISLHGALSLHGHNMMEDRIEPFLSVMLCASCGAWIDKDTIKCPQCGKEYG